MIKKLRIKLIVASMISLFLVLFIIGGIAGVLNYRKIAEDADRILEVLEKNAGHFPKMIPGNEKGDRHGISPEIPYESRYFSVLLDEKGDVKDCIHRHRKCNRIRIRSLGKRKRKRIYGSLSLLEDVLWRGDTCYFLRLQETAG